MRVIAAVSDNSGCGFYRMQLPANAVMRLDPSVTVEPIRKDHFIGKTNPDRLVSISEDLLNCDLFIIQRPMAEIQLQLLRTLQQAGVPVVVELDDDMRSIHKNNVALRTVKPHHLAILDKCVKECDLFTCSTEAIAKRYGKGVVIPNYVLESWLDIEAERAGSICGYTGTLATHPDTHARGVGRALDANSWRFRVVGRPELIQDRFDLSKPPEITPWVSLDRYPHEVAKFDIGLAPLNNTVFNRAKSWLKMLEYAALGVPCIGADVGEYRELNAQYGIGLLAGPSEWHSVLDRLIKDRGLRNDLMWQGYEAVTDHLTIERQCYRWLEAWTTATTQGVRSSTRQYA